MGKLLTTIVSMFFIKNSVFWTEAWIVNGYKTLKGPFDSPKFVHYLIQS